MLRLLTLAWLLIGPGTAAALCEGRDLIAELPPEKRAALTAQAAGVPYSEGLLWRARRGATEIVWFGTYHFAHAATQAHLAAVMPYISAAQDVYLEVSNADTARMQREIAEDPSIMFITEGPTLPDLLGPRDWPEYRRAMQMRAIPSFMAAKFKPVWAAMMLGIGPCEARNGALEGDGIDKLIGDRAAELGNPSKSLEDYRTLLTMLDGFADKDQLDMIRLFLAEAINADDLAYTLRVRYLRQQVALTWEFSREMSIEMGAPGAAEDFALFEHQLLDARNRAWVARLLDAAAGRRVFAAAGAAHLPGENGVLRLLETAGFEIERLPFDP